MQDRRTEGHIGPSVHLPSDFGVPKNLGLRKFADCTEFAVQE
jgi:hypothetical protein